MTSFVFQWRRFFHTKPLPCWCCKQRSVLRFFSTLDPAMIQLLLAESQLIAEHSVPPHVQVLLHMLVTPAQTGLVEKGSLPVRSSCKHWVQICTRLPTVPTRWQGEKTCGVVFLGRPLHLTSPVLYNLSLDMVPSGVTPAETWFCGTSAWFALWDRPYPDQSNVACLVQTPIARSMVLVWRLMGIKTKTRVSRKMLTYIHFLTCCA